MLCRVWQVLNPQERSSMKTQVSYLQSSSLWGLMDSINNYNENIPDHPILKDDIIGIQKIEETYVLLYYK